MKKPSAITDNKSVLSDRKTLHMAHHTHWVTHLDILGWFSCFLFPVIRPSSVGSPIDLLCFFLGLRRICLSFKENALSLGNTLLKIMTMLLSLLFLSTMLTRQVLVTTLRAAEGPITLQTIFLFHSYKNILLHSAMPWSTKSIVFCWFLVDASYSPFSSLIVEVLSVSTCLITPIFAGFPHFVSLHRNFPLHSFLSDHFNLSLLFSHFLSSFHSARP